MDGDFFLSTPNFDIRFDPGRGYSQYTLRGHWDEAVVDSLFAGLESMGMLGPYQGRISHTLIDALECGELSPQVVERFPPLIARIPLNPDKRMAIILSEALSRAWARPVAEMMNARFFHSRALAEAWLFSDEA